MKKIICLAFIISALLGTIGVLSNKLKQVRQNYSTAMINYKASYDEDQNKIFELTIAQVCQMEKYDSLLQKVHKLAEDNDIKDKRILALQYVIDNFNVADTVYLKDSIFVNITPDFKEEVHFGDEWHNLNLLLEYPNKIAYNIGMRSEKNMIIHNSKETIKPESKVFFIRWFQKKHWVIEALVVEENPWVDEDSREHKFIKVVRKF